jgi:Skp family chaperone for outer membrane proteins
VKTTLYSATLVAVLFSLGFATQSTYAQTAGTRVAVIDIPYILKSYPPFKAELEKSQKNLNDHRRWQGEENQKIRAEMGKLRQFKTGSPEYKAAEEGIAEMQLRLRLESAKREKAFVEAEAQAYYNTYKKIESVVADFAFRNQIGLVVRFNREEIDPANTRSIMSGVNRFVVFQNRLDITDLVLDALVRQTERLSNNNRGPSKPAIPPRY